ncbi:hypothetical protein DL98DRAFT_93299 [Cadophora sp. DSE1049]|nr:hypothetical protein DL98DRAFT_93299 [Cadophora sp. DSE1049]
MTKLIPRRALLIGCDYYAQGDARIVDGKAVSFNHLLGCVEDVRAVEKFLGSIGVPSENIQKLTASCNVADPTKPSEDSSAWPNYDNVIKALDRIVDEFKKDFEEDSNEDSEVGGLVYIHYAGHGIRRDALPKDVNPSDGDNLLGTALAMTDVSTGGAYLTGYQLGVRIQGMVLGLKKRLRVTLVLDSCFSGGGFRASGIRTIPVVDTTMLEKDKMADRDADRYLSRLRGTRQASLRESWLSNPVGCTVLTACDINQVADENWFKGEEGKGSTKRGAFTWWMCDLLSRYGQHQGRLPTHNTVRDYVKENLGSKSQEPILYGEGNIEFFGYKEYVKRPACRVSTVSGEIRLHVGSAQGVAVGAIYDIYPPDCDIQHEKVFSLALQAKVTMPYQFYSTVQLDGPQSTAGSNVRSGSLGVLRAWALHNPVFVNFVPENAYLKRLLEMEMQRVPNLRLHDGSSAQPTLTVTTDNADNFEIDKYGIRLERLPTVSINDKLAIPRLIHVLRHVTRYSDIQGMWDRPRTCIVVEEDFDIRPTNDSEMPRMTNGIRRFTLVEGETLTLEFAYTGPLASVWVQFYELNASWGIEKKLEKLMYPKVPEPPVAIVTTIPPKGRENDAEDVTDRYMIFISDNRDRRSWDEISLPCLPIGAGPLESETADYPPDFTRGEWVQADPAPIWGLSVFEIRTLPRGSTIDRD